MTSTDRTFAIAIAILLILLIVGVVLDGPNMKACDQAGGFYHEGHCLQELR